MKKIVFMMPFYMLPLPSTMGGGVEELMTLLLNEHEKQENPEYKFYFVNKKIYGKNAKFQTDCTYKNSEVINIKYNRFFNTIIRLINKGLKILKIKKRFQTIYYKKAFNLIKKLNPDQIIFERDYFADMNKYAKTFGKEKLSFHVHTQVLDKENISEKFGSIITVSKFIADDWKDYLNGKPMNYHVLPNCVNEDRFNKKLSSKERNEIRTNLGFDKNDFVVLFCGRIHKDKGIDKLIDAIIPMDKQVKLLIVGSVSAADNPKSVFENMIKQKVRENPERIKFTGYVNNSELYKIYQSSDIQIVPSVWEEAAGLVVIEGQHSGLPQIVTQSGGMVEFANPEGTIIVEKENNLVENLTSEINKLKNDSELRANMSESNKKHAQKFDKVSYYKNFLKIAEKITRKG